MSRALWWVTKGLAEAPPGWGASSAFPLPGSRGRSYSCGSRRRSRAAGRGRWPGFLIRDEIDVALAVLHLHVGEAVELVRQRPQGLGQQAEFGGRMVSSPVLVFIRGPDDAENVAQVPGLEGGIGFLPTLSRATQIWIRPERLGGWRRRPCPSPVSSASRPPTLTSTAVLPPRSSCRRMPPPAWPPAFSRWKSLGKAPPVFRHSASLARRSAMS